MAGEPRGAPVRTMESNARRAGGDQSAENRRIRGQDDTAALRADQDEREVVGAIIRWPELVSRVRERVEADDFRNIDCALAFAAICTVADRGEPPIYTSVCAELRAQGAKAGLSADVADWATGAVTPVFLRWHCLNVLRASQRRRLRDAGGAVATRAIDPRLDADAAVDEAQEILGGVRRLHHATAELYDPEAYATLAAELNAEREAGEDPEVLPTDLYDLDECLAGGARPGQLIVIGARPGMGKSSMLRDFARSFANRGPVLFVSNEMSMKQVIDRDLAVYSGVDLWTITRGKWGEQQVEKIHGAENKCFQTPIHTIADSSLTTARLRLLASEVHAREGIKAVVVDYLQRIPDPGKDSLARVGHAIRALKSLAMELDVPVVVGSQLNRGTENRPDNRPNLSDLRESGEIEQESDVVLLLHRKGYYDPSKGDEAEIIVAKNRQGPSGTTVKALWCGPLATFRNLAKQEKNTWTNSGKYSRKLLRNSV